MKTERKAHEQESITREGKLYMNLVEKEEGFTLVEALITILVVGLALLASLVATTAIQRTSESAHERAVAIQDANRAIEQMRNTAKNGSFPSVVTAAYPENTAVAGFTNLTSEGVNVTYVSATADPLDATVTVTWTDNTNRSATASLRTLITQRS